MYTPHARGRHLCRLLLWAISGYLRNRDFPSMEKLEKFSSMPKWIYRKQNTLTKSHLWAWFWSELSTIQKLPDNQASLCICEEGLRIFGVDIKPARARRLSNELQDSQQYSSKYPCSHVHALLAEVGGKEVLFFGNDAFSSIAWTAAWTIVTPTPDVLRKTNQIIVLNNSLMMLDLTQKKVSPLASLIASSCWEAQHQWTKLPLEHAALCRMFCGQLNSAKATQSK